MTYQHQKDINGCGVACLANVLDKPYDVVKKDFEKKFYTTDKGIKVFDMKSYLNGLGLTYDLKFFNQKDFNKKEADTYTKISGSITLITKSEKYPIGHYLLRAENGWIDPWYDLPSIDNVQAGIRKSLPNNAWYVIYPVITE